MSSHVYIIIVFFDTILHEERRNILNGCLLGLNWVGFLIYRVSLYRPVESICLFWVVTRGLELYQWIYFRAYEGTFMYLA